MDNIKEFSKEYFNLLTKDYAGINLTRINNYEEFFIKQIKDSIDPARQSDVFKDALQSTKLHIDVGFGGGFPLLPLAFQYPNIEFKGLEARNKKVKVVNEIISKLGLRNVKTYHYRLEEVLINKEATISFKAVGTVNDYLEKINTNAKIKVFFYKAKNFYALEEQQIAKAQLKWNIIEQKHILIEGNERYLIGFEKKNINEKILNTLVRLSELN